MVFHETMEENIPSWKYNIFQHKHRIVAGFGAFRNLRKCKEGAEQGSWTHSDR